MNYFDLTTNNRNKDILIDFITKLHDGGFEDLKNEILSLLGMRKLPNKTDDNIIEQILPKGPQDKIKKIKNIEYYKANAICFFETIQDVFNEQLLERFKKITNQDGSTILLTENYNKILVTLLNDFDILKKDYENNITHKKPPITYTGIQDTYTIYPFLLQVIYGQSSFHSFSDKEPNMSIAVIRQMIELRIRRAFGILGISEITSQNELFKTISMNRLFMLIGDKTNRNLLNDIDFSIPFHNINRIYSWANIFMHVGTKEYIWVPIKVAKYLHPMIGKNGISFSESTLISIQNQLKDSFERPNIVYKNCICKFLHSLYLKFNKKTITQRRYKIISCTPEANIFK